MILGHFKVNLLRHLHTKFHIDLKKMNVTPKSNSRRLPLRIYGVGGKQLSAIKSFYEAAPACVKINGETSEHFEIEVGLRQGCVMSWLFNIYMDGVMREVKSKVGIKNVH